MAVICFFFLVHRGLQKVLQEKYKTFLKALLRKTIYFLSLYTSDSLILRQLSTSFKIRAICHSTHYIRKQPHQWSKRYTHVPSKRTVLPLTRSIDIWITVSMKFHRNTVFFLWNRFRSKVRWPHVERLNLGAHDRYRHSDAKKYGIFDIVYHLDY